jgi:hypothetical protein
MINGILVVFLVIMAIGMISLGLENTVNTKEWLTKAVIMIVFLAFFTMGITIIGKDIGYKKGQIDALTNNVQYKLVTMPDSTKVWEKIGETK